MNIDDFISKKVSTMPPSGIRKFFDLASKVEDIISLGVGEPDFITPWNIRETGIYSLEKGYTFYTSNSGLPKLREEICNYLGRKYNLNYLHDEILVTVGASESIDLALRAIINNGDEVIIPEPCFVSYKPCTILAGGVPVVIDTKSENNFKVTSNEILEKITSKTKAIILSYPNNPTGAILDYNDLKKIVDVLKDKDIIVISDEIYSELTYNSKHISIASFPEMKNKTILINGFSKSFAMTGWRLGYSAGNKTIINNMTKIHQYTIMSAPTPSQYAGIEALQNSMSSVGEMTKEYNKRRKIIVEGFNKMGLVCFEPKGAFYVFPSIKKTGLSSEEFAEKLIQKEKVAVVPGNAFGDSGEGFIRCSYAYSLENIMEALKRIEKFVINNCNS